MVEAENEEQAGGTNLEPQNKKKVRMELKYNDLPEFQLSQIIDESQLNSNQLYYDLLDALMKTPLLHYYDVSRAVEKQCPQMDPKKFLVLYQNIDKDLNGGIDVVDLVNFYTKFQGINQNFSILLQLINMRIKWIGGTVEEYLSGFLGERDALDFAAFNEFALKAFEIDNEEITSKMFAYLDTSQSGSITVAQLAEQISSNTQRDTDGLKKTQMHHLQAQQTIIDSVKQAQQLIEKNQNNQQAMQKVGLAACSAVQFKDQQMVKDILSKYPPLSAETDCFEKFEIVEGQEVKGKWKTILNSESACIRMCLEILLSLRGSEKWTDYEFGPCKEDPSGGRSLYSYDNEIPPGCPEPEDVVWLRPEEII